MREQHIKMTQAAGKSPLAQPRQFAFLHMRALSYTAYHVKRAQVFKLNLKRRSTAAFCNGMFAKIFWRFGVRHLKSTFWSNEVYRHCLFSGRVFPIATRSRSVHELDMIAARGC